MTRSLLIVRRSCGPEQILDTTNILDKTTATTETFYNLLSLVCDADGNNSRNSYVSIGLNSSYIHFYMHHILYVLNPQELSQGCNTTQHCIKCCGFFLTG